MSAIADPMERNFDQPESLRIAWVNEDNLGRVSGVSNTPKNTIPHLAELGHDVTLIYPGPAAEPVEGARTIHSTRAIREPKSHGFYTGITSEQRMGKILDRGDGPFDVVIANSPMRSYKAMHWFLGGSAIDAAFQRGIPTLAIAGTNNKGFARDMGLNFLVSAIDKQERHLHGRVDINLSPSEATDTYLRALGLPEEKIARWTRGIAPEFTATKRDSAKTAELRKSWGAEESDTVIVTASRLTPEKSIHKLKAIAGIPNTKLVIAGDGSERKNLEGLFGEDAIFMGMLNTEELSDVFAASDIFAYASETDTYAQVVPQAQASGLALVVADAGGPSGLVQDGISGRKYQPTGDRNTEEIELRNIVQQLIQNPDQIRRLGTGAVAATQGRTWGSKAQELVDYCRQAIDLRNPAQASKLAIAP